MSPLLSAAVASALLITSSAIVIQNSPPPPPSQPSIGPQVQKEQTANAIAQVRARNMEVLALYNWNCRTEILDNGKLVDLRIDLVNLQANGQLSRMLLNDQPGRLPGGFLRHAIAQGQQQKEKEAAEALCRLVDQYTLMGADRFVAYIITANIESITGPAGESLLRIAGTSVIAPGDTLTMTFDAKTLLPTTAEISTTIGGQAATASASFNRMVSGLNRLQFASGAIPGKQLTINIHNYDFIQTK